MQYRLRTLMIALATLTATAALLVAGLSIRLLTSVTREPIANREYEAKVRAWKTWNEVQRVQADKVAEYRRIEKSLEERPYKRIQPDSFAAEMRRQFDEWMKNNEEESRRRRIEDDKRVDDFIKANQAAGS